MTDISKQILLPIQNWSKEHAPQHAECKVFVASHSKSHYRAGKFKAQEGRYELSRDVIQCTVDENFNGSTAQMTLAPKRPYHKFIWPGDWISIYLSTGADARPGFGVFGDEDRASDNTRVFMGIVDAVRRNQQQADDGTFQMRYSISCSGLVKVFQNTTLYYNPMLSSQSLFGAFLPGLAVLAQGLPLDGTPTTLPRALAMAYAGFGGQFIIPESYAAMNGLSTEADRRQRFVSNLERSILIEQDLGIINVRGADKLSSTDGLVASIYKRHKERVPGNAITAIMDLFTYVDDLAVDGKVINCSPHDMTSNLWSLMRENSNPVMNEMFVTLLDGSEDIGLGNRHEDKDEWGMSPRYVPCLVIREKPFSTTDDSFTVPKVSGNNETREISFGNRFFSRRDRPVEFTSLQQGFKSGRSIAQGIEYAESLLDSVKRGAAPLTGAQITNIRSLIGLAGNDGKVPTEANLRAQGLTQAEASKLIGILQQQNISNEELTQKRVFSLDRVRIRQSDIKNETLGLSDNDMSNLWMLSQASTPLTAGVQKYTLLVDGLIPIYLPESIKRYGLRVQDLTTKFTVRGGGGALDHASAVDFLIRCLLAQDLWYQNQPWYEAGTITTTGIPKARIGMALDIEGERNMSYYIEGVAHEWTRSESSSSGPFMTTLTVTRGQPSGDAMGRKRFPYAPPDVVNIFRTERTLDPKDSTKTIEKKIPVPRADLQPQPKVFANPFFGDEREQFDFLLNTITEIAGPNSNDLLSALDKRVAAAAPESTEANNLTTPNYLLGLLKLDKKITAEQKIKIEKTYAKANEQQLVPLVITAKADRVNAASPPWLTDELRHLQWDPIRREDEELVLGDIVASTISKSTGRQ